MNIRIKKTVLQAAIVCVAKSSELRYYLQGVCIDPLNGSYNIVATDGHIMVAFNEETELTDVLPEGQIILPTDLIKQALKASPKHETHLYLTDMQDNYVRLGNAVDKTIDGRYPQYSVLIPAYGAEVKDCLPNDRAFDPALSLRLFESLRLYYGEKKGNVYQIIPVEERGIVQRDGDHIGIIMPMRMGDSINVYGLRG